MSSFRLLFLSFGIVEALQRAQLVPQSNISKRLAYNGGWALGLAGSTCPADAPVACPTNAGSINPTCCPSGQTCSGNIHPYCCPNSADCINVVTNVPVCANSTWNMYTQGNGDYFCCEPGQYGVLPLHGYAGICEPLEQAVASSLIATPASQAGGAPVTSQQVAGAGPTNTLTTLTSTLKNGGTTTITTALAEATATSTSVSSGQGSLPIPSGGASATITLTRGAEIGIAVGAAVVVTVASLILWYCLRQRRRKRLAAITNANNNGMGMNNGQGTVPMYSALPAQGQGQASPLHEYKTPLVGVGAFAHDGLVSPNTPPPMQGGIYGYAAPQGHGHGNGGNGHPNQGLGMMEGRHEAPGTPVPAPVEAPNSWERGIRM